MNGTSAFSDGEINNCSRAFSTASIGETVQHSFVCQSRINNDVLSVLLIFWVAVDWIWYNYMRS